MGFLKNVMTFGAAGRIEAEHEKLLGDQRVLEALHRRVEARRVEVNVYFEQLVATKVEGVRALQRVREISHALTARDRQLGEVQVGGLAPAVLTFSGVERTLSAGETALNATKGVAAGVSTAAGAWALATTFGAASTGTALSTLSGAALTNATLAWFGGGAVAAGGGGMAAGAAVLGGVVALPALALLAIFSHASADKKILEMQKQGLKLIEAQNECRKLEVVLDLADKRARELTEATQKAQQAFEFELQAVRRRIYRWGWLSRLFRSVRKRITGRYFGDADVLEVARLGRAAAGFARILDLKVFDNSGQVVRGAVE